MLSFECIKNEKSVYFLLTSALLAENSWIWGHYWISICNLGK